MKDQSRKQKITEYKERKEIGGICAIKNTKNGKMLLSAVNDIQAYKNRFEFSKSMKTCLDLRLKKGYDEFGQDAFVLEVLDELEKKNDQSPKEFSDDIKMLKEIWVAKFDPKDLY